MGADGELLVVRSFPPSHSGDNKYCVTVAGRGPIGRRAAGSGVCRPSPLPAPQARPSRPPSLGAQDDVDAGIREHGPAHLPCPQREGGIFKWLLHLTWGHRRGGAWGVKARATDQAEAGQADVAPACAEPCTPSAHLSRIYGAVTVQAGPSWGWQGH